MKQHGIRTRILGKPSEGRSEILDAIRAGYVSYVINTRAILSGVHYEDGAAIRSAATQNNITMLTSLDTVKVLLDVLEEVTIGVSVIDSESKKETLHTGCTEIREGEENDQTEYVL